MSLNVHLTKHGFSEHSYALNVHLTKHGFSEHSYATFCIAYCKMYLTLLCTFVVFLGVYVYNEHIFHLPARGFPRRCFQPIPQ